MLIQMFVCLIGFLAAGFPALTDAVIYSQLIEEIGFKLEVSRDEAGDEIIILSRQNVPLREIEAPQDGARYNPHASRVIGLEKKFYFVLIWDVGVQAQRVMLLDLQDEAKTVFHRFSVEEVSVGKSDRQIEIRFSEVVEREARRTVHRWPPKQQ